MAKWILAFVIGGALGTAAGFVLGIFVYPYLFLADIVAAEKVDAGAAKRVVARGTFIHAKPSDPIHYGKGRVTVHDGRVSRGRFSRSVPARSSTSTSCPRRT